MADADDVLTPDDDRAVDALRALADGGPSPEQPSPAVWERIAAEAFADEPRERAEPADSDEASPEIAPVVPLARRPPRVRLLVAAAAAAAVVVLVVGGGLWVLADDEDAPATVATGELARLDDEGATPAAASVVEVDGRAQLRFEPEDLPTTDGFFEVWIGTPELDGLISLGPLRPDGTYDLPAGLDVGEFPVVDVSDEPLDGVPSHSSVSVLRGQLA
jgi:hypothetical protein